MNNPPFNEWTPGFKASDAPVTPGDDPSSFADLDDAPPEDEPYSNSDIDTRKITVTFFHGRDRENEELRRSHPAATGRAYPAIRPPPARGSCRG